jgi:hypothetical protein
MMYQPPSLSGGMLSPYSEPAAPAPARTAAGMNSMALQFTEASMFRPMISKAMKPNR